MSVRKRVAEEARRLASECVEGRAPSLIAGNFQNGAGQSCALGWILRRSGKDDPSPWDRFYHLQGELERDTKARKIREGEAWRLVLEANNNALAEHRAFAVVFPLLALADTLEGK